MRRSFSRKIDQASLFRGAGGCTPCDAAAAANGGIGALTVSEKKTYLTYGFVGSIAVGAVGFMMSSAAGPVLSTIGLVGLFGTMAGLAMMPSETGGNSVTPNDLKEAT